MRPMCRLCHIPLVTHAEQLIGVHVSCVHEADQQTARHRMPAPSYSFAPSGPPKPDKPWID